MSNKLTYLFLMVQAAFLNSATHCLGEGSYVLRAQQRHLQCLLSNSNTYLSLKYDPIVVVPADCPRVTLEGVDLAALVQNSGKDGSVMLISKEHYSCFLKLIEGALAGASDSRGSRVLRIRVSESRVCD